MRLLGSDWPAVGLLGQTVVSWGPRLPQFIAVLREAPELRGWVAPSLGCLDPLGALNISVNEPHPLGLDITEG